VCVLHMHMTGVHIWLIKSGDRGVAAGFNQRAGAIW